MAVQIVSADDNVRQLYTQQCAEGRCGECQHLDICGGNTRVRAWSLTGDPWQEDPACYLTDEEIGASGDHERLQVTPYHRTIRIKQA